MLQDDVKVSMIGYTFILKEVVKGKVEILHSKILPDLDNDSLCYNWIGRSAVFLLKVLIVLYITPKYFSTT